jgi:hypothetical protein
MYPIITFRKQRILWWSSRISMCIALSNWWSNTWRSLRFIRSSPRKSLLTTSRHRTGLFIRSF